MAEDLHKDNLENFFKDAFDEQSDLPAVDGWDVPSDQVWEKIEQSIHQTGGSDKGLIWWKYLGIGALTLIVIIAGVFYFSNNKEGKIDQEVIPIENRVLNQHNPQDSKDGSLAGQNTSETQAIDQRNEKSPNDNNPDPETKGSQEDVQNSSANLKIDTNPSSEKSLAAEGSNLKESTPDTKKESPANNGQDKVAKPFEKNKLLDTSLEKDKKVTTSNKDMEPKTVSPKSTTKSKDIATVCENNQPAITNDLEEDTNSQVNASNDEHSANANSIIPVEVLQPIPTKGLLAEVQSTLPDTLSLLATPFTDLEKKPEGNKKSRGFYAGLSLAPTYTDRQIKIIGNPVIPRDLNKNEKGRFSYSIGVNAGYKLSNNWSIESGFNYSTLVLQHKGRKQVRYTSSGEQENDRGELERNYNFNLGTSSGDVNTDIALARDASTPIAENEFITLQIKAKQNIQYGSIPIIARYQFGKGKVKAGLKAGLVNRFVLDGALRIEEIRIARSDIRLVLNDRVYQARPLRNIKKYEADFLIGAGISYHFNNKMWFFVEPTFTRSINPLFETHLFKTYPVITSLDIGVNYLF